MGYRGKTEDQARARQLRAEGWTMPEIAAELAVSRSSVSLWTRDVPYTPRRPRARPATGPNRLARARLAEIDAMRAWGRDMVGDLSERDLLVAGAALYAGEGAKTDRRVAFANSDERMVALFLLWMRTFFELDESRLRVRIYLHEGLDLAAATAWWASVTGVPTTQFGAPYRAVPDPSIRHAKHPMGCVTISYSCARTHRAIMGLVRALLACPGFPG
ncbi:MAG: hypothetical protein AB7H43_06835 [Acidimicrobiia bacterium]